MKVLLVHNKYRNTNIGGEDVVFEQEASALKAGGNLEVYEYVVSNDQIKMFYLPFSIWFSVNNYLKIRSLVRCKKIDIVHVHNFFPLLTPSIFLAAKRAGAKIVLTLHSYRLWCISGTLYRDNVGVCEQCTKKSFPLAGIRNRCYRSSLLQSLLAQFSFYFYKKMFFFSNVDVFFVLTEFQKNKVIELGIPRSKIMLKSNGVVVAPCAENSNERKGYIFVGRLENNKGTHVLLEAWKKLPQSYHLTIIGNSPDIKEIQEKHQCDNVVFKGKCSHEETIRAISQAKYLLQTSLLYETFGLTIIEAFACGTPVIGFSIGTRSEFIHDTKNGFLCMPDTLVDTIKKSYNYSYYDDLSKNALNSYQRYEMGCITKKQIRAYEAILKKP